MNRAAFLKKARDRRHAMLADHEATKNYAVTGKRFGVSRQRAHAMIKQARREKEPEARGLD